MNQSDNPSDLKVLYAISRGLILISILSSIIISTLVLANYFQDQKADPLNSSALSYLNSQLKEHPQDDLMRDEIRSLHLLSRKAYFNSLWQIRTGGYLILLSLIVFSISLKINNSVKRRLPDPSSYKIAPDFLSFSRSVQNAILGGGSVIFAVALIIALGTTSNIPDDLDAEALLELDKSIDLDQHWANFRGPGGNGIAIHTDVPTEWDGKSGQNILWKTPIPRKGYSSPIVINDRLFVSGGDENLREVFCLSAETGELLWQQTAPNMVPPDSEFDWEMVDPQTGFAAPTMASNGKRVIVIFATGDIVCYSMEGDRAWGRNLGLLDNHYAHSSSLIINGDLCLVQYDSFENPRLIALDIATGAIAWEVARRTISWASPICVNTGGRTELILADSKSLSAYNPETGEEYWSIDCLSGEVGASPAYSDGMVFCANEYANASGLKINAPGNEPAVEIVWQVQDNLPNTSSPVASGDFLVLATSGGMVSMVNAKTGAFYWDKYLGDGYYASPIIVGDLVYLLDLSGVMFIFKLAAEYELINTCNLGEDASSTPAFMPGRIYIRGIDNLYCIGTLES